MSSSVAALYRFPVKGLSPQRLDAVDLTPSRPFPSDRIFAIAHEASGFDQANPAWQSKRNFITLLAHERLASLQTDYDPETGVLTIHRDGKQVARGQITTPLGKDLINQFLAAFLAKDGLGHVRIVEGGDVVLTDVADPYVSIINRASVQDVERVARGSVDPVRFRGNILIDGGAAWAEMDWVGKSIQIGDVRIRIAEQITRCAATTVNPNTAERDLNIPKILMSGFGHTECGVYGTVETPGALRIGDTVTVL